MWARFVASVGMDDGEERLSFNKLVSLVLLLVFSICALRRIDVPWPLLSFGVVIQGAGFGLKGFMAALANRRETFNATLAASKSTDVKLSGDLAEIVKAIKARRDDTLGVEVT
jgi:hypothetical protein